MNLHILISEKHKEEMLTKNSTTLRLIIFSILFSTATNSFQTHCEWHIKKSLKPINLTVPDAQKLPLVFHPNYDISFFGIEKVHPFDSKKYGKIAEYLKKNLALTSEHFHHPQHEVSEKDLLIIHSQKYLDSLKNSFTIEKITELPLLRFLPNFMLQRKLLSPMLAATQGTIDAAFLAQKNGVGINLSGGYHHAKPDSGGGFCVYADIPLAIQKLREKNPNLKVLYVDLDAHQGDGVEKCLLTDKNSYILDCFNEKNYPQDSANVAHRINKKLNSHDIYCDKHQDKGGDRPGYKCQECSKTYLHAVTGALSQSLAEFKPDIIFYNAGTDCFEKDQIGTMALDKESIITRDQIVFEQAKKQNIPLCMTLSGGYSAESFKIIGASIVNLHNLGLLNHHDKK